ncbi:hypothetical protein L195_g055188 [Trifolium pratense]|uniref:Uncharacterized protein n=1 Tax=Trifolium pratense TaxID=57577 RepID=A0A2K3KK35_TRIPR|nr:hypothetical protein L195_g055188 [Trifolium pratense]
MNASINVCDHIWGDVGGESGGGEGRGYGGNRDWDVVGSEGGDMGGGNEIDPQFVQIYEFIWGYKTIYGCGGDDGG